jgi:tetraacyldisaccharide 4'-kinase
MPMSDIDAVRTAYAGSGWRVFVSRWWTGRLGAPGIVLRVLLVPAELAYRTVTAARNLAYDRGILPVIRAPVPVISVGNLSVGGTGKTPFARWLVSALRSRGARPSILHGGYGDDEPALHRRWNPDIPIVVGRDRIAGARAAAAAGSTVVVLDDGFQHRRLARDLDIVLVAAEDSLHRCHLLPNGPWRERLSALSRADLLVVTRRNADRGEAAAVASGLRGRAPALPIVTARIHSARWTRAAQSVPAPTGSVLAVTGIARPDLFVASGARAGAHVDELLAFPDHHAFTPDDVGRIRDVACGRPIITTEKDAVRLAGLGADTEMWILEQDVEIEAGGADLDRALDGIVQ